MSHSPSPQAPSALRDELFDHSTTRPTSELTTKSPQPQHHTSLHRGKAHPLPPTVPSSFDLFPQKNAQTPFHTDAYPSDTSSSLSLSSLLKDFLDAECEATLQIPIHHSTKWEAAAPLLLPPILNSNINSSTMSFASLSGPLLRTVEELEQVVVPIPSGDTEKSPLVAYHVRRGIPEQLTQVDHALQRLWEELDTQRSLAAQADARRRTWRRQLLLRLATAEETHKMLTAQLSNIISAREAESLKRQTEEQQRCQLERRVFGCYASWDLMKRKLEEQSTLQEECRGRVGLLAQAEIEGLASSIMPSDGTVVHSATEQEEASVSGAVKMEPSSPHRWRKRGVSSVSWLVSLESTVKDLVQLYS